MEWLGKRLFTNPSEVLDTAGSRPDIIQGLVPQSGVTWLYGPSMSFKSFIAMSMAAAVANGRDWMSRPVAQSTVIYIGAEGGQALHIRRGAAEMHVEGDGEAFALIQERPQLDTREGADMLKGVMHGLFNMYEAWGDAADIAALEALLESPPFRDAAARYDLDGMELGGDDTILIIVDTYSQTSSGDDKVNVAAYMKTLRDAIDQAALRNRRMSFIVVDHATKAGGTYLGSVSKLNDVDSQLEIARDGNTMRVTMHHRKSKDGRECAPVHMELHPFVFEDKLDAYGEPISTLVVGDGVKAAALAEIADGKAGLLMDILAQAGGAASDKALRKLFYAHPDNASVKQSSRAKTYGRCKRELFDDGVFSGDDDRISLSLL